MAGNWLDISTPIAHGMAHWPSDPDVIVDAVNDGEYTTTRLSMSAHTGTHVDAPAHCSNGPSLDGLAPEKLIGPARVIRLPDADECSLRRGDRILIKTTGASGNSARRLSTAGAADITLDTAARFAAAGLACVGIDSLTIGSLAVHRMLLENGVWVIEGLDLGSVEPGPYELVCLPLRIAGADGAPARAVLRSVA